MYVCLTSSLVGFLNDFLSGLYLGLTNSLMAPFLSSSTRRYATASKMSTLMLPGYTLFLVPATSGSLAPLPISPSSWLYSTLMVSVSGSCSPPLLPVPGSLTSLQMAPTASPCTRGTVREFTSSSFSTLTPSAAGMALNTSPLVSWKKTTCLLPFSCTQRCMMPFWYSSMCTSPWPCGFVSSAYLSLSSNVK